MRVSILLISCLTYLNCFGQQTDRIFQNDSIQFKHSNDYLENVLGRSFLKDSLIFQGVYRSELSMYVYEIKQSLCKNTNKNVIIVFFDGDSIETKYNTKISRQDINNYFKGLEFDNIFLNKEYVLTLAKNKLKKGIREWQVKIRGVADSIYWEIDSFDKERLKSVYSAGGQCFEMNIRTGKFRLLDWIEIE